MATIYVENQPYQAEDGQNLLHACLSLGFNLPYFCWHPALGSVGACRQCAVRTCDRVGYTTSVTVAWNPAWAEAAARNAVAATSVMTSESTGAPNPP